MSVQVSPLYGFVDSNWAADKHHHHYITGFTYILGGATVLYMTHFQQAITMSSTEIEFVAASDAGKIALYLHSILHNLNIKQTATLFYGDNMGAYKIASAGQSAPMTRYIDIQHFAPLDWVKRDLIAIKSISTTINTADVITKITL